MYTREQRYQNYLRNDKKWTFLINLEVKVSYINLTPPNPPPFYFGIPLFILSLTDSDELSVLRLFLFGCRYEVKMY